MLLLGAPGSGKGTQTARILEHVAIPSLASGDILRNEVASKLQLGTEAAAYIGSGRLVPDATMVQLITDRLKKDDLLSPLALFLLDGFPRTRVQAELLRAELSRSHLELNLVVELDVDQKVILERINARWVHRPSGRVYNLDYNPPKVPFKDDVTGEPLEKRKDDTPEIFQLRLDTYNAELAPLKRFYASLGILETVSGDTSDIIFPKLKDVIKARFGAA